MSNQKIVFFGAGIMASVLIHNFFSRIGMVEALEDARQVSRIAVNHLEHNVERRHDIVGDV